MRLMLLLACLLLGGCQAGYFVHVARGHLKLMSQARPVAAVLADSSVAEAERRALKQARSMLAFARTELGLETDGSYRDYVHLERDWVVWNLFAAPEFSMEPRQWCYPVAGCVSYRGYFDRERARRRAEKLRARGLDVYGAGAAAYSTLGWFDDPLTTPMLERNPAGLAELLFHELAHRWLYVSGATRFNESMATALAAEGTRRWLAQAREAGAGRAWRAREQARRRVTERVRTARARLKALYARDLPPARLRERKRAIQAGLRTWFAEARRDAPELAAWARWFDGPLNNAQLNTLLDYNDWVPAFNRLLLECGGHWSCFRARIKKLAEMDAPQREQVLERLHD